jgi:alkylated DNA repair protein (DNA oxidative demethylase)
MSTFLDAITPLDPSRETMAEGAVLLRGAALPFAADVLAALPLITAGSPFRHMVTPGGFVMSVAMTNCGAAGWVAVAHLGDAPEPRFAAGRVLARRQAEEG